MKNFSVMTAIVLALGILVAMPAQAATTTYSNTTNATGYLMYGNQMGDDLHMTSGGVLDSFSFSLYNGTGFSLAQGETIDFKVDFYNDSLNNLAGTVTFDDYTLNMGDGSKVFTFSNISDSQTINLTQNVIAVLTWGDVMTSAGTHFSTGVGFGQLLYDPPTVGSSNPDSFILNGSAYTTPLLAYGTGPKLPSNLYWEIGVASSSHSVPEPFTALLLAPGLIGLAALRRKFRK